MFWLYLMASLHPVQHKKAMIKGKLCKLLKSRSDQPFFFLLRKKNFLLVWEANTKGRWWNNWGHMQAGRSIAKFRNLVSELCRSLVTKGMSWCEANLSVEVLLTLHWYTGVWTKIELVCSGQIQKVKSDSDDAPCDDFFYPPLLTLCCPYRLNSELPHCLVLGSSQRLRGREPCVLMATRHLDCFEKQPSRLITVSRLAVLSGEGYWEVTPSLRGPLVWDFAAHFQDPFSRSERSLFVF